jgi:hypothetical protein
MKKIFTLVTLITAVVAVSTTANAQEQATLTGGPAETTTRIVAPIAITTTTPLNFGQITTTVAGANVKIVAATGARTSSNTAAIRILNVANVFSTGLFAVTGEADYEYTVTLPVDDAIELSNGAATDPLTMKLQGFETNLPENVGALGIDGKQSFNVGATLIVAGNQAAGDYSGTYDVTVRYN